MNSSAAALVAVDLGASSGRVIVGRLEGDRLLTVEVGRFPNRPVRATAQGRSELHWDIGDLWSNIFDGLRIAARDYGPIAAIGIDSWAVDFGLLDDDGALLGNPVHYRDPRTAGMPEALAAVLSPDQQYALTGTQRQPFNTVYQLLAAAGTARLGAAARMLMIPDLLGYWLSGLEITEVTNASSTGMLNPRTRSWSHQVLAALDRAGTGDIARLLAPLVEPGTVLGPMLPDVAADLGLAGANLVAIGSHDTASAVAAVPIGQVPAAYISSGTWSLVGVELDAPVLTEESRAANFTNELGIGGTVRYLRNVAGLWLLQESVRTWTKAGRTADLATLLAAAGEMPKLRTVIDVDDPVFIEPGDMAERIRTIARRTGQPVPEGEPEIVRCILDSLALAYRRAVRQAVDLSGRQVEVVHVVGGGARNALLGQLTADATGLPVIAGPTEATATGNLLTQALATGLIKGGLAAIRNVVRASVETVRWAPTGSDRIWRQAEARLPC